MADLCFHLKDKGGNKKLLTGSRKGYPCLERRNYSTL